MTLTESFLLLDPDPCARGLGVLDHVGHRLLNQPVNGRLEFWRMSSGDSAGLESQVDIERHIHSAAFTDAIHQDLERGLSAELVECGRSQLRDQTLQASDDLLDLRFEVTSARRIESGSSI